MQKSCFMLNPTSGTFHKWLLLCMFACSNPLTWAMDLFSSLGSFGFLGSSFCTARWLILRGSFISASSPWRTPMQLLPLLHVFHHYKDRFLYMQNGPAKDAGEVTLGRACTPKGPVGSPQAFELVRYVMWFLSSFGKTLVLASSMVFLHVWIISCIAFMYICIFTYTSTRAFLEWLVSICLC